MALTGAHPPASALLAGLGFSFEAADIKPGAPRRLGEAAAPAPPARQQQQQQQRGSGRGRSSSSVGAEAQPPPPQFSVGEPDDFECVPLDVGYGDGSDRLMLWLPLVIKHVIDERSPLWHWATGRG